MGASDRDIPAGLQNSGKFERRVKIATATDTIAVVHFHCSTKIMTMMMRLDIELDNEDQIEQVEALLEGSESGPDVHLQFVAQNTADEAEDLAIEFRTTDGDTYSISIAFTSAKSDSNGNGPAHVLASVTGKNSDNKARLTVTGGNTDVSGASASSDLAALPFDVDATFSDMKSGNKFCINTTDSSNTTGCPDADYPNAPVLSGITAWTLEALYALRQEDKKVISIAKY
jgi:hypothetical protein